MMAARGITVEIPLRVTPVDEDGWHLMAHIYINGRKANVLIDTGASRSVFDKLRLRRFLGEDQEIFDNLDKLSTGMGTNTLESQITLLKRLKLGKILVTDYKAVIMDMEHVNQSYRMLHIPMIDGVLGGDLLVRYGAVIDYRKKVIRFREGKKVLAMG